MSVDREYWRNKVKETLTPEQKKEWKDLRKSLGRKVSMKEYIRRVTLGD